MRRASEKKDEAARFSRNFDRTGVAVVVGVHVTLVTERPARAVERERSADVPKKCVTRDAMERVGNVSKMKSSVNGASRIPRGASAERKPILEMRARYVNGASGERVRSA